TCATHKSLLICSHERDRDFQGLGRPDAARRVRAAGYGAGECHRAAGGAADFAAGDVAAPGGVARGRPGQRTAAGPARAVPGQPGGAAAAAGVDAALPGVLAAAHRGTEGFSHGDGPMPEAAVEDDLMVE